MKSFLNRVAVVTGAGSGMGRAYALELAQRGASLALNDVDQQALDETVRLLPDSTAVFSRSYDVSDRDATYVFAHDVRQALGPAYIVINNAGVEGANTPVWNTSDDRYRRTMEINHLGVVYGTRAFLPDLLDAGEGAIVNVSSLFGLVGTPSQSDYCGAKFAVRGFTEALATELVDSDISVHTVHPGGIDTAINRSREGKAFKDKYLRTRPEEITRVVLDAVGTRRTRIVYGHRSTTTWLGARFLPQWLMSRLVWRDMAGILDPDDYQRIGSRTAERRQSSAS